MSSGEGCAGCGCYWLVFYHQPTGDQRCYACRGHGAKGTPCESHDPSMARCPRCKGRGLVSRW